MKKILISVSIIVAVTAIVFGATTAYFSDTETSAANTFSTGTIDIEIEEGDEWSQGWVIKDMKPCETGYITFNIENPGDNPVNVWKKVIVTDTSNGEVNEPECLAEGGYWGENGCWGISAGNWVPRHNLHGWMNYDLSVEVPIDDNSDNWYQTIFKDEDNVRVSHINGKRIFLGMIPAKGSMEVTQSYHLIDATGNWAQADIMNFTIEIYAEQLRGELVLENKTGNPDWQIEDKNDGISATLTYNMTGPEFVFDLDGVVELDNTEYGLIYYPDPWPGTGLIEIGKGTSDSNGKIIFSDSKDLGKDLPIASDQNSPEGAKIWLVPTANYTETTGMTAWNPDNYLFETGLITYTDTDN